MPKLNVDTLFEPLTVVLGGIEYPVVPLTAEIMQRVQALVPEDTAPEDVRDPYILNKQVAIFLGQPEETFKDVEMQKLSAICKFVTDQMTSALQGKDQGKKRRDRSEGIALIVGEFPGQFRLGDLLEMDVRDYAFWFRQSQIRALRRKMEESFAARMGMCEGDDYLLAMRETRQQILLLEGTITQEDIWDDSWEALSAKGGG